MRKSKNAITIEQLRLACRHVHEMQAQGVTENLAIRSLEIFSNVYAKLLAGGSATPDHVSQVKLWSRKARQLKRKNPHGKAKDLFRVEHGTPRRAFARMVLKLHSTNLLNEKTMRSLVRRYWKIAVITLEEDQRLNKIARSKAFRTPDERWSLAGIRF